MRLFINSVLAILTILTSCNIKKEARFVLVPDTQTYAEKYPEIVTAQTEWIAKNAHSIDLVLQQGDLTQNNSNQEWEVIKKAFSKLDNKVPYVLAVGNHDMGSKPGKFADTRNTELFNQYFPVEHMSKLPAFVGTYQSGTMDNSYYFLETGKIKWMIISLEFGPRNIVLDWANNLVSQHPDKTVIINTHAYMYSDSTRQGNGDNWRAQGYGVGKERGMDAVNDGDDIWNKLVRKHPNVRFVFSGHVLNGGVGTLVSINDDGLPVYQMLANYQEGVKGSEKGGNGFLRILEMNLKKGTLEVKTYSPYINEFNKKPEQQFSIKNVFFKPQYK